MSQKEDCAFVDKIFEIERQEWSRLSMTLRQHGLSAVDVLHPGQVQRFSEIVIMMADTAKSIRQSMMSLMRDGDRRQELVREMIITNGKLREELKAQAMMSLRHEDEVRKLRAMLAESSNRLQESFDESKLNTSAVLPSSNATVIAVDNQTSNAIQLRTKCEQLRQKCEIYEQEVNRLAAKNERFVHEEENRRKRESQVFEHLRKRSSRENIDETMLSIIDSYERQIYELRQQLEGEGRRSAKDCDDLTESLVAPHNGSSTPNFKALIRAYEKNMLELKKKLKLTEDEREMLKLELQSRPQVKDMREAQLKIKQHERLIRTLKTAKFQSSDVTSDTSCGNCLVTDIDFLPPTRCRQYVKLFCKELNVNDVEDIVGKLRKVSHAANAYCQLEQFACEVLTIVDHRDLPRPPELHSRRNESMAAELAGNSKQQHEVWCEKSWKHVLPTLEYWTLQLRQIKELQQSIMRLINTLFPWQQVAIDDDPTMSQLIETIDSLLYENHHVDDDNDDILSQTQSKPVGATGCQSDVEVRAMLQGIVGHFQKLFNVPNIIGVYARMSDIYRKLGETHNVLVTLRDLLGLDEAAMSGAIVDAVAQLCDSRGIGPAWHSSGNKQQSEGGIEQKLAKILHVDNNMNSIVSKVEEQQEYLDAFRKAMAQLMSVLGVQQIDEVVPMAERLAGKFN